MKTIIIFISLSFLSAFQLKSQSTRPITQSESFSFTTQRSKMFYNNRWGEWQNEVVRIQFVGGRRVDISGRNRNNNRRYEVIETTRGYTDAGVPRREYYLLCRNLYHIYNLIVFEYPNNRYSITFTNNLNFILVWTAIGNRGALDSPARSAIQSFSSTVNTPATTQQNFLTYRNQARRFTINYPANWRRLGRQEIIRELGGNEEVMFKAPNFPMNFNVNVSQQNRRFTTNELFQLSIQFHESNRNTFVGYRVSNTEAVVVNGLRGAKITASYRMRGVSIVQVQYAFQKPNNTLYVITFTVGSAYYDRNRDLIENIIQSFRTF